MNNIYNFLNKEKYNLTYYDKKYISNKILEANKIDLENIYSIILTYDIENNKNKNGIPFEGIKVDGGIGIKFYLEKIPDRLLILINLYLKKIKKIIPNN
jgi:hypothetical protein